MGEGGGWRAVPHASRALLLPARPCGASVSEKGSERCLLRARTGRSGPSPNLQPLPHAPSFFCVSEFIVDVELKAVGYLLEAFGRSK